MIGLFGLVGMFGVFAAPLVGRVVDNVVPWMAAVIATIALIVFQSIQVGAGGINIAAVIIVCFGIDVFRQTQQVALTTAVFGIDPKARSRLNSIILTENMLKHLDEAPPDEPRKEVIFRAASEVGRPVLTAISTTVLGFLPVFVMTGPEGKMFRPLAYTKTFALIASVIIALTLLPPLAHILFSIRKPTRWLPLAHMPPSMLRLPVLRCRVDTFWS